jgi:hypothetical protein
VSETVREIGWALEEKLLWRCADVGRRIAEIARWPLERIGWVLERRLIWPVQDRAAGRIPAPPSLPVPSGHLIGAGALAAVGLLVVTLGVAAMIGGKESGRQIEALAQTAATAQSPAAEAPSGAVLQGAPPSFEVEGGAAGSAAAGDSAKAAVSSDAEAVAATGATGTATTSSKKAVPAGPAAMRVARRFANAFLFYEIGVREERAHAVFAETTSAQLERALIERPPRQPEAVQVPQARLLNLVPGPRHGDTYTVSASLLRVGTTSELRLDMRKLQGNWVVTDVRG